MAHPFWCQRPKMTKTTFFIFRAGRPVDKFGAKPGFPGLCARNAGHEVFCIQGLGRHARPCGKPRTGFESAFRPRIFPGAPAFPPALFPIRPENFARRGTRHGEPVVNMSRLRPTPPTGFSSFIWGAEQSRVCPAGAMQFAASSRDRSRASAPQSFRACARVFYRACDASISGPLYKEGQNPSSDVFPLDRLWLAPALNPSRSRRARTSGTTSALSSPEDHRI